MGYVEEACIIALLTTYIHLTDVQQTAAYQISVMAPNFTENVDATVVCKVNNSELNAANCPFSARPITKLRIILSNDPPSTPVLTGTDMCDFSSFLTCTHDPPVSALECGCYHDGGDIYTVNVTVRANSALHENKTIDCRPNCVGITGYGLVNTVTGVPIAFVPITTTSTTTEEISTTTITTTPPPPFPGWCIAVIVIGIILFIAIIAIVVIIKKCKKEEERGNRFHCCSYDKRKKGACPCGFYPDDESSSNNVPIPSTPAPVVNNRTEVPTITPDAQGGKKWTELTPTTAPGGNNRTELTAQL